MNIKSHKNKSGFMLEEVMIALVITSLVIMPVLNFIGNYMMSSTRYKDKGARLIVMKNLMLEQNYKAQEDKAKQKTLPDQKIKDPAVMLKYTRNQVGKQKPFENFTEHELKNLLVQKVEATAAKNKESIVCFLYKP